MKTIFLTPVILFASLLIAASAFGEESEEEIIQSTIKLARAYLGDSDKLDSIKSIRYKGSLMYGSGSAGTIEMVYQEPLRHRMVAVVNNRKEVSALNGTEGWTTFERVGDSLPLGMEIFDPMRILIMQASARDALGFYKKPATRSGNIYYNGKVTFKGRECVVLTYDHGDGVAFRRFIDAETGKLHRTIDTRGVEFYEEGEIVVEGVRFPKKLITAHATAIGTQTMEFDFTSIELNRMLPASDFKMPLPAVGSQ